MELRDAKVILTESLGGEDQGYDGGARDGRIGAGKGEQYGAAV